MPEKNVSVDPGRVELWAVLDEREFDATCNLVRAELKGLLQSEVPYPDSRESYDAVSAAPLLTEYRKRIEAAAMDLAQGFGPIQWLWYLRRTPDYFFEGRLATTLPYDSTLAEVISATSKARGEADARNNRLSYPTTRGVAQTLYRFVATVRYLSQIHVASRWSGKGAPFVRNDSFLPLDWVPDMALERDVERFDQRVAAGSKMLAHSGTFVDEEASAHRGVPVPVVARIERMVLDAPFTFDASTATFTDTITTEVSFGLTNIELGALGRIENDPRIAGTDWRQPWLGSLLALMSGAFLLALRTKGRVIGLMERGFLISTEAELMGALGEHLPPFRTYVHRHWPALGVPATARELIAQVTSIPSQAYPLGSPPVLRREGPFFCIDLSSATTALQRSINLDGGGGDLVNARAEHFELAVQAVLDKSRWKPSAELRQVRGRTLLIDGTALTDIDAIGELGEELIVVSCKSRVYSDAYDIGDYRVVRNRATDAENAVRDWDAKVAALRARPCGDNYDFSHYRRVFGVVCTPTPVFVRSGTATRLADRELPVACAVSELERWAGGSVLTSA